MVRWFWGRGLVLYDMKRIYGKPMSNISITEKYYEMVDDGRIRKKKVNARKFFQTIGEIQMVRQFVFVMFYIARVLVSLVCCC